MPQHSTTLRAQLIAETDARFEILFLQADEANGYTFPAHVLKASVPLWEECSVFVDHSPWGRSVRDLGGVLSDVGFNREYNGLTATLQPCGPSAEIVLEAARILLGNIPHPDLGFSADLIFLADANHNVQKIMQPLSVDLVIDPAFATRFIRQLNASSVPAGPRMGPIVEAQRHAPTKESHMKDPSRPNVHLHASPANVEAQQIEASRELLNARLRNAELPAPAEAELRARFDGRIFTPEELSLAVNTWKSALAEIEVPDEIEGPRRITSMFDTHDQVQAAIDDLVGAPREHGAEDGIISVLLGTLGIVDVLRR